MEVVAWRASRIYLAVDASAVTAAAVARGLGGERLLGLAHEPLPPGSVVPGPLARNLADGDALRAAAARALERSGCGRGRITLVLPDGCARLSLLEPAPGVSDREYVRYRLASSLPWPASEAAFEALAAGRGRVVGAAVRRATVAEYEHALAAAGIGLDAVHLAPLVALERLRRRRCPLELHAVLGDVAACLAVVRDGAILSLRYRRRDRSPGEAVRLRAELLRLAAGTPGASGEAPLVVSGSDAPRLRPGLEAVSDNGHALAPLVAGDAEAGFLLGLAT